MSGNAKRNLSNFEGAIFDLNKALDLDPLYADGYFNRGIVKFQNGNFHDGIEDYSKVIKINPNDSDAFFNRASVKKEIGDMKGACEDLREAGDLGDEEAEKLLHENCE